MKTLRGYCAILCLAFVPMPAHAWLAGMIAPPYVNSDTVSNSTPAFVGTGATGIQVDPTKWAFVSATFQTSFTVTLGGTPSSLVVAKICATNSATESDWATVGATSGGQPTVISVTVGQQNIAIGQIFTIVPPGWYLKYINSGVGTHAETSLYGQKWLHN